LTSRSNLTGSADILHLPHGQQPADHLAAVDDEDPTGDIRGRVGAEQEYDAGYLLGLGGAMKRDCCTQLFERFVVGTRRGICHANRPCTARLRELHVRDRH
jgi:hypothetical protein